MNAAQLVKKFAPPTSEDLEKKRKLRMNLIKDCLKDDLLNEYVEKESLRRLKFMERKASRLPPSGSSSSKRNKKNTIPAFKQFDKETQKRIEKQQGFINFCNFEKEKIATSMSSKKHNTTTTTAATVTEDNDNNDKNEE